MRSSRGASAGRVSQVDSAQGFGDARAPSRASSDADRESSPGTARVGFRVTLAVGDRSEGVKAYVHALSPERDALLDFVEDAESSFLEYGIAPTVDRPSALSVVAAQDHARTAPTADDAAGWLPYLTPEAVAETTRDGTETLHYVGVAGMAVTARVLRETTGSHPDVVLQTHTYASAPLEYTVHRYDRDAGEFSALVSGHHS
jgi:hypothetical protein